MSTVDVRADRPESFMGTRAYAFHGIPLTVSAPVPLFAALHARLRDFYVDAQPASGLRFDFCPVTRDNMDMEQPSSMARVVYESPLGQVLYDDGADRLFVVYESSVRVVSQPAEGYTRVAVVAGEDDKLWLVSHPFFTIPFIECLKRRGRYNLHAAGLCVDGKSVLLPGHSGSGKSTLAIALARAGFGFLSDDMVFLTRAGAELRVLAFRDEIDVTEQTAEMFPELRFLLARPRPAGWHKRQFLIEDVYPEGPVLSCQPAALVFPRIAYSDRSVLKEMKPDEALREILPNVLLTSGSHAQAHLDTLGELVRTCACFRLETGCDFEQLGAILRRTVS